MTLRLTYFGSLDYWRGIHLRNKLLKQTSGKSDIRELPIEEKDNWHIVVLLEEKVVGTIMLEEKTKKLVQIKQVAIDNSVQGQGLGKKMMDYSEELAKSLGFTHLFLTGRESAWMFYDKLGFYTEDVIYFDGDVLVKEYYKQIVTRKNVYVKEMETNG
ncbi:MAG: GNAT family N-acetyltransferase [Vagococcus sp.]